MPYSECALFLVLTREQQRLLSLRERVYSVCMRVSTAMCAFVSSLNQGKNINLEV